jgi:tRNA-specific 2-thiouridylase
MSGGVDSSLAAALLKDAGAEVIGVFMHVWDYSRQATPGSAACCAAEDAHDARRVANVLGISFYTLDMRDAFRRDVINPFIDEYESGRTPNPCANCNQFVKFGALLETAKRLECEYVATGHYVQRRDVASDVRLFRGADRAKDQSYFLATISRDQARHILFPVGHLNKAETRRLSAAYGLPTASKHESQDICFIPAGDRVAFLRREGSSAGFRAGEIVDRSGRVVGHHDGIAHFTIGQRKGLGLSDGPWNVVALDSHAARVVVDRPSSALIGGVYVQDVRWIRRPDDGSVVSIKTRYRSPSIPCRLEIRADGIVSVFERPQPPTAPGQVAAFYDGDELLGGGIIHDLL